MEHQSHFRGYPVLAMVWVTYSAGLVSDKAKEPSIHTFLNSCTLQT